MQYGYFDSEAREYVVTRPDTPAPWANYLGAPEYGAIITSNAGGYSFVESGAAGRILRYRFNEQDRPGRYIYLRDDESGEFWSASWQPVARDLSDYQVECRHGTGYTSMAASCAGIASEALYYVPLNAQHEVWSLKVSNTGDKPRRISIFGYAEFTNDGNYEQDGVNLQYSQFISRTHFDDGMIRQTINENCADAVNGNAKQNRFFYLAGAPVSSFCGDREQFLGAYRDYGAPRSVEDGRCNNGLNYNGNACGALHTEIILEPGESCEIAFVLGQADEQTARALCWGYEQDAGRAKREKEALRQHWHGLLQNFAVQTPDADFDNMINTWNAYQCFITFIWSRAASLAYCGLRNGYGYRDTVQDIQGIIHLAPEMAREKLLFMLSAQVHHGGALPLVKYTHTPGRENTPDDAEYAKETGHPSYRADDALWLFPTVYKYIAESGDVEFLDVVVPYADKGEDTVYRHLYKAVEFSLSHLGVHGLPAGLHADWNDCLRLGEKGASVFVAMQLYYAFDILNRFAQHKQDLKAAEELMEKRAHLGQLIEQHCWDEDRYVRGISASGELVGARGNAEASLWLNPQSWAVISGCAEAQRGRSILDLAERELGTEWGSRLMAPSYKKHPFEGALAVLFNPGAKENGGIFLQPQGWLILAEALLGNGDAAYQYYKQSCPAAQNSVADIRLVEPYVYSQFTEGSDSPFAGRSHVHWLTGTASTVMVGSVEGILGMRPDMQGLRLSPALPEAWNEVKICKRYRGCELNIEILRKSGPPRLSLVLNGEALEDNYIPAKKMQRENTVVLEIYSQ